MTGGNFQSFVSTKRTCRAMKYNHKRATKAFNMRKWIQFMNEENRRFGISKQFYINISYLLENLLARHINELSYFARLF